jgi:hypothetical protein
MLQLAGSGTSSREIAVVLGVALSTVQDNLKRAALVGLTWPLHVELTDDGSNIGCSPRWGQAGQRRREEPARAELDRQTHPHHASRRAPSVRWRSHGQPSLRRHQNLLVYRQERTLKRRRIKFVLFYDFGAALVVGCSRAASRSRHPRKSGRLAEPNNQVMTSYRCGSAHACPFDF